jgi:ribosomal protein S8
MNKATKNLLLSLKNCSSARLNEFYSNYSKKNLELLSTLYGDGFIQSFIFLQKSQQIKIFLRYVDNKPIFSSLKLISTASKKSISLKELSLLFNKRFVLFLNTNLGLLNVKDCKKAKVGGKILFFC